MDVNVMQHKKFNSASSDTYRYTTYTWYTEPASYMSTNRYLLDKYSVNEIKFSEYTQVILIVHDTEEIKTS